MYNSVLNDSIKCLDTNLESFKKLHWVTWITLRQIVWTNQRIELCHANERESENTKL